MTFLGMDPAAVQRAADALRAQGRELDGMVVQVDALVEQAAFVWPGPDSDRFRETWFDMHRPSLLATAAEVAARSAWLASQVEAQLGVSGMSASDAGPGVCEDPSATTGDLLDLSRAAYNDHGGIPGWDRLSDEELGSLGIDPALLQDPTTGFSACVFRNAEGALVVAYRGTTEWVAVRQSGAGVTVAPGLDLHADVLGSTYLSRQSEQAVALALAVQTAVGTDNVVFTGHSLGGRLAALASIATGAPAETFNAAGMSPSEMMYAHIAGGGTQPSFWQWLGSHDVFSDGNADAAHLGIDTSSITNHSASGDVLSGLQSGSPAPDALGNQHVYVIDGVNPVDSHSLDTLEPYVGD